MAPYSSTIVLMIFLFSYQRSKPTVWSSTLLTSETVAIICRPCRRWIRVSARICGRATIPCARKDSVGVDAVECQIALALRDHDIHRTNRPVPECKSGYYFYCCVSRKSLTWELAWATTWLFSWSIITRNKHLINISTHDLDVVASSPNKTLRDTTLDFALTV